MWTDAQQHILIADATLDREDQCIFYGNYKSASMAINKVVLGDRAVRIKHDRPAYEHKLSAYSESDIVNMFKFTVVRNPWARVVSAFHYLQQVQITPDNPGYRVISPLKTFESFVTDYFDEPPGFDWSHLYAPSHENRLEAHFSFQWPRVYFKNNIMLDYVAKLEELDNTWPFIAHRICGNCVLPHANKSNHKSYQEYYTPKTRELIERAYNKDIGLFDYEF